MHVYAELSPCHTNPLAAVVQPPEVVADAADGNAANATPDAARTPVVSTTRARPIRNLRTPTSLA
jgi:hypothetical protein